MWDLGKDGLPLVIVVKNGILESVFPCKNGDHAEKIFRDEMLKINASLEEDEIADAIEDGSALFDGNCLCPSFRWGLPKFDTSIAIHWITGSFSEEYPNAI